MSHNDKEASLLNDRKKTSDTIHIVSQAYRPVTHRFRSIADNGGEKDFSTNSVSLDHTQLGNMIGPSSQAILQMCRMTCHTVVHDLLVLAL